MLERLNLAQKTSPDYQCIIIKLGYVKDILQNIKK